MTVGIYKITNLINNKIYIGQSIHIERRWQEHKKPSSHSQIGQAIQKYGADNFSFEIIEKCPVDQLNERETYWINYFNSLTPNGYNILDNSESNSSVYHCFDKERLLHIISDLQNLNLTLTAIANQYGLNVSTISRINAGEIHRLDGISYPVRFTNKNKKEVKLCPICGVIISNKASKCLLCENQARKNAGLEALPIKREELKLLIRTTPFTKIAKQFSVSDNTIRKWCLKLNLPSKSAIIKQYSDKEWEDI